MADHLTIETPEQIHLEFPLAGVGSRFLALALDTLIQLGTGAVVWIIAILLFSSELIGPGRSGPWALAVVILLTFLLQVGYFALFEAIWNGQTPGKRRMHLRVIEDSGRPITVYDSVARNLLRIVDSIPGIYAVGILCALLSSQNKRLGDYVAGTVVVHEAPLSREEAAGWNTSTAKPAPASSIAPASVLNLNPAPPPRKVAPTLSLPSGYDASRLTMEEFAVIETFLLRRLQLVGDVRNQMARKIVERIATQLQVRQEDLTRPESLLEKLAVEYRNRTPFR